MLLFFCIARRRAKNVVAHRFAMTRLYTRRLLLSKMVIPAAILIPALVLDENGARIADSNETTRLEKNKVLQFQETRKIRTDRGRIRVNVYVDRKVENRLGSRLSSRMSPRAPSDPKCPWTDSYHRLLDAVTSSNGKFAERANKILVAWKSPRNGTSEVAP